MKWWRLTIMMAMFLLTARSTDLEARPSRFSSPLADEIRRWVLPMLQSYFPELSTERIEIIPSLATPVTKQGTTLQVRPGGVTLTTIREVSNFLTHEAIAGQYSLDIGTSYTSMREWVLETIRVEGVKAYIAGKGQNLLTIDSLTPSDIALATFIRRDDVEPVFYDLREIWQSFADNEVRPRSVQQHLLKMQSEGANLTLIGSFMAKRIEEQLGKAGLAKAARLSGEEFYATYARTRPGALLLCPIPASPKASRDRHDLAVLKEQ